MNALKRREIGDICPVHFSVYLKYINTFDIIWAAFYVKSMDLITLWHQFKLEAKTSKKRRKKIEGQ